MRPETGKGPFPFILWIHGGAWRMGDKKDYGGAMLGMSLNIDGSHSSTPQYM